MTRPDLTGRQVVDRFFYEYEFHVYGTPYADVPTVGHGFCGLEWRPLPGGRLLVITYEHPDNPGRSVTNAAEDIAQQFAAAAGVELDGLVWVESYAVERPTHPPEFDRCRFGPGACDSLATTWHRMTTADWQVLGVEPPVVPHLARRP